VDKTCRSSVVSSNKPKEISMFGHLDEAKEIMTLFKKLYGRSPIYSEIVFAQQQRKLNAADDIRPDNQSEGKGR